MKIKALLTTSLFTFIDTWTCVAHLLICFTKAHSHKCRALNRQQLMWHTGQCLWRRTAMVAQWRSSDHRSQPGCAPGYPHFQPCSRSVWLGWWRLVQHSGKHLHPPWKTEHRNSQYRFLQVWSMCIFVCVGNCSQLSCRKEIEQNRYLTRHVYSQWFYLYPKICMSSCQAGTVPADFTYLDYLLLCGGWCDKWLLEMKTYILRGS